MIYNFQVRIIASLQIKLKQYIGKKILNNKKLDKVASKLNLTILNILINKISKDYLYKDLSSE